MSLAVNPLAGAPIVASIPSPTTAVWHLGPIPIRAYALCIIAGIVAACLITDRRLRARGAPAWSILDVAVYAVPFGIIGARIYHVITTPDPYFGKGGHPIEALYIWNGGLGIWGAVAGGAVGAWLACRQLGMPLTVVADSLAVGLPVAQAIGRWGNWFNNELYGGSTTLPWGLQVHQMSTVNPGHAEIGPDGQAITLAGFYHPTFLYESIWDVLVAVLVIVADRRFKFGKGRAFALYVMAYTLGRGFIEAMRTDPAHVFLGMRLNVWTSIVVFLGALAYFLLKQGPREYLVPDGKQWAVVTEAEYAAFVETGEKPERLAVAEESSSDDDDDDEDAEHDDGSDEPDESDPAADADEADAAVSPKAKKG